MSWNVNTVEAVVTDALKGIPATMRSRNTSSCTDWTRQVKDVLCAAGLRLGFKVGASGCNESLPSWGEWLYDLTWVEANGPELISLPLAVESEWGKKQSDDLAWDFNKLVQSSAGLRVLVFEGRPDFIGDTIAEFKKLTRGFKGSTSDDRYLFAGFDWDDGEFRFEPFANRYAQR